MPETYQVNSNLSTGSAYTRGPVSGSSQALPKLQRRTVECRPEVVDNCRPGRSRDLVIIDVLEHHVYVWFYSGIGPSRVSG